MAISDLITSINTGITNIANAIRAKTGSQSTIPFASLPSAVNDVYDKAVSDMWDMIQRDGTRTDYEYGFTLWKCEYLRPKYKVIPTTRNIYMFRYLSGTKKIEKAYFDLSQCDTRDAYETYGNYYTFYSCPALEEIEDIGMKAGWYSSTFGGCTKLHTIEKVRFNPATPISSMFYNCSELQNITIDGTIGQSGLNLQYSTKLTKTSIESVLDHMKIPEQGETFNKSITFSQTAVYNSYTQEEWATRTATLVNNGWTISLV